MILPLVVGAYAYGYYTGKCQCPSPCPTNAEVTPCPTNADVITALNGFIAELKEPSRSILEIIQNIEAFLKLVISDRCTLPCGLGIPILLQNTASGISDLLVPYDPEGEEMKEFIKVKEKIYAMLEKWYEECQPAIDKFHQLPRYLLT